MNKIAESYNWIKISKQFLVIPICCLTISTYGQKQKNTLLYLSVQTNIRTTAITRKSTQWGAGIGSQVFFLHTHKLNPTIEFTSDIYLSNSKILITNTNGEPINQESKMTNFFAGLSYRFAKRISLSTSIGMSSINSNHYLGIKPAVNLHLSKKDKLIAKLSYIQIMKKNKQIGEGFNAISFALSLRIF